jgi:hypothetical protein
VSWITDRRLLARSGEVFVGRFKDTTCDPMEYPSSRLLYYRRNTSSAPPEEGSDMSSVTSSWRQRRQAARTRRALAAAVARTSSPAMRDELLTLANSNQFTNVLR